MAKTLDFNKIKRNYFKVTLNDENKTELQIMTPTKQMLEAVIEVLPKFDSAAPDADDLASLYEMAALLMSRNRKGIHINADTLTDILDMEDLALFFSAYVSFVNEISQSKN